MQTLTIPGDLPGLNEIIDISKAHWGAYSKTKKDNTEYISYLAKSQLKPVDNKVDLDFKWYCPNRRKDKDNIMAGQKFILDGLVAGGIIDNDNWGWIGDLRHSFEVDKDNPRIEVTITERR